MATRTWLLSLKPNTSKRCRWSWLMRRSKRSSALAYWNKLKAIQVLGLSFISNSKWKGKERRRRSKRRNKSKRTSSRISLSYHCNHQLPSDNSRTDSIRITKQWIANKEDQLCTFNKSHPALQLQATHSQTKNRLSSLKTMERSNHELHRIKTWASMMRSISNKKMLTWIAERFPASKIIKLQSL